MIKLERSLSANFDAAGKITVRLEFDDDGIVRMFADTDKGSANCSWTIDIKKKSLEFTQRQSRWSATDLHHCLSWKGGRQDST
jgi:hypothetical protein